MAITFRQLQYFLALAEELHFGRAAQKLHISQPPLSASLKQLEAELGYPLMERTNRSVRLTDAGAVFADHAARILGQLDQARALTDRAAKGASGRLAVAFVPSMLFRNLPAMLRRFQESHPDVELLLSEMNTVTQIDGVLTHGVDAGFIHDAPVPDELDEHVIEMERLVCCLPRRHRLAGRSRIALEQLAGERVLVFAREYAAHYHDHITGLLRAAGVEPYTPYRLRNWFTVVALVAQGMGVSLVPRSLSRGDLGDVVHVEIEGRQAEHKVSLIWRRDSPNEALAAFRRFVRAEGLEGAAPPV